MTVRGANTDGNWSDVSHTIWTEQATGQLMDDFISLTIIEMNLKKPLLHSASN